MILTDLPERQVIEMIPAQTLGGIVQDQAGQPIPDAAVRVEARRQDTSGTVGISRIALTDTAGRWLIEGIPREADSVSLGFKHPEYISDKSVGSRITGEELLAACDLKHVQTMMKGLAVNGRVVDDRNHPVPRAAVVLAPARSYGFQYDYADTLTDASGRFHFGCARNNITDVTDEGGSTGVLVELPGYLPQLQRVVVEPNLAPLEFRLDPGRAVTVRVVDANDRPIAGASAVGHFLAEDPRYGLWLIDTDAQSQFQIPHAPQGDVLVSVLSPSYVSVRNYTLPAPRDEYVVKMTTAPRIEGAVCDARTGESIREFVVIATFTISGRARTSEPIRFQDGGFELKIDEVTSEAVQLRILAAGYKPTTSESFRPEGTRKLEFKLEADPSFNAKALQRELSSNPSPSRLREPSWMRTVGRSSMQWSPLTPCPLRRRSPTPKAGSNSVVRRWEPP